MSSRLSIRVLEYDEDPALFPTESEIEGASSLLMTMGNSLPRRQFQLDLVSSSSGAPVVTALSRGSASSNNQRRPLFHAPKQVLMELFLPLGFPHSVDDSYLMYQVYDSLQGLCSYLRGVVSTSAVLSAAGVGNAEATALGAAMTWALKDGMGLIGGLVFSFVASHHYDAYVKEFRLFADLINDVGLTFDMVAPLVPTAWLLPLLSCSTLSKTMCGMSAGATKSSITVHLAREGNMADLNAKEGTQETLVSLVGMMLGVQLAHGLTLIQEHYADQPWIWRYQTKDENSAAWTLPVESVVSWTIFLVLTVLHMWWNYQGVRLLKLTTLNRERATQALEGLVDAIAAENVTSSTQVDALLLAESSSPTLISGPGEIDESMARSTGYLLWPKQRQAVQLGVSLVQSLQQASQNPATLVEEFQNERYLLGVNGRTRRVVVTLRTGAKAQDELKSLVHSLLVHRLLWRQQSTKETSQSALSETEDDPSWKIIQNTHALIERLFRPQNDRQGLLMEHLAAKGWETERLYLGFGRQRTSWESTKRE